jgi:hypothetical protein
MTAMNEETTPQPRRNKLAWLGWILWLTTIGGLFLIRHEAVRRDAEIRENQRALLGWIERANQSMAAVDTNKMVATLVGQNESFTALQSRTKADGAALGDALKQQTDLNARLLDALGPETGSAEDALKLADEAKNAGKIDLALVYVANAIRSHPRDVRLLNQYIAWAIENKNPTVTQGAKDLLLGSLYGVAAKDVPTVVKLLEDVTKVQNEQSKIGGNTDENQVSPASSLAELGKVPLESFSADRKKLEARIEALAAILEQITESGQEDAKLREQVNKQLEKAQACAMAHQVLDLASLRFANLATTGTLVDAAASNENRTAALSALQATEAAVNQIWSVPMSLVTPDLRDKLVELPEKLKKQAEIIQDNVEKDDMVKAREIWTARGDQQSEKFEECIMGCQKAIEVCSKLLAKVQGPKAREEASALYKEMSETVKNLKERQLIAYQKWATEQIEAARARYNKARVCTDQDAFDAFYKTEFQTIDQKFLTPDVEQFLQGVFTILLNELDQADYKAELQREMAFPSPKRKQKRSLESF